MSRRKTLTAPDAAEHIMEQYEQPAPIAEMPLEDAETPVATRTPQTVHHVAKQLQAAESLLERIEQVYFRYDPVGANGKYIKTMRTLANEQEQVRYDLWRFLHGEV